MPYHDHVGPLMASMSDYETRELAALAAEQVTHPVEEYATGSDHFERLWEQIELANKWTWPQTIILNV